ncbi:pyridoxal phosphate-dependent transferase [Gigaspora rosea]|uniref:Pyridoxal phosphate-dependent transferase n=1 Tax=Gigaspora rosea TaxID=44941 RepID=A0A397VUZ0_9GLOM|nr:pyridoxal phosphate-dependent transferase [Gigaspora rosea]
MASSEETNDNVNKINIVKASEKVIHFRQDVWSIFTPLALKFNAVNLGQGFMNFPPPNFVKEAAVNAILHNDYNQYSHPKGSLHLRKALANTYSPLLNRTIDPETEILISAGVIEGLYSLFAGLLDENDEVIVFEPFYNHYPEYITMNGGIPIYVTLHPQGDTSKTISSADWKFDINELRSKITSKTKMIIFNTPHNPTGKVFSTEEMIEISEVAREFNLIIISDEVYDRLCYKPYIHEHIANLPEMWERTITLNSCSKTFGVTGWRVGWLIGPKNLISPVLAAHTRIVFCVNAPLQVCSYYILVNISKIRIPSDYQYPPEIQFQTKDYKFCYWMTKEIGVVAIPPSEFYSEENKWLAQDYVRFAFCKTDDILDQAAISLQKLKNYIVD